MTGEHEDQDREIVFSLQAGNELHLSRQPVSAMRQVRRRARRRIVKLRGADLEAHFLLISGSLLMGTLCFHEHPGFVFSFLYLLPFACVAFLRNVSTEGPARIKPH